MKDNIRTISDVLNGRRSARIGTLIDGDRELILSLRHDTSQTGTYSVVISNGKNSESFRMMYPGGMNLTEVADEFTTYLNTDSPNPSRFSVQIGVR